MGLGPGLARSGALVRLVAEIYGRTERPMVVDADGLNALSENPSSLTSAAGPRILTPHVGEFRRLADKPSMNAEDCQTEAKQFASDHQCIVVMKGHRTLVTDGNREFNNETGNPGMATADRATFSRE